MGEYFLWRFTDQHIFRLSRLYYSIILAVSSISVINFLETRNPGLETWGRLALRTCFVSASLPWILFGAGLGVLDSPAFVILNMLAFSTSYSSLFFSNKRSSKIGNLCSSCSVLALLAAIGMLIVKLPLQLPASTELGRLLQL